MANEDLARDLRRLRRLASLTQEELAGRSGISVDVIRQLEQRRKQSARLPTLHALANGLGVELTTLLGDPPAVAADGETDGPRFVAMRRAVMPVLWGPVPQPPGAEFAPDRLREQIADGWSQYHAAEFDTVLKALPDLITDARSATVAGDDAIRDAGFAALGKALQLSGHVAVRMGRTDLALIALERAMGAAEQSRDPLLPPMIVNSVAWTYQRQGRLDDALYIALRAADGVRLGGHTDTADGLKVWGALTMSAATSAARSNEYQRAAELMAGAEKEAARVAALPAGSDSRMVSVFSPTSVRIERVRLAVQYGHPEEALELADGIRLSKDTPPSWRTWLLLDVARAHTDLGDAAGAVKTLESLRRAAPTWMRHHTLAVAIVRDLWALPNHPVGLRALAEFVSDRDQRDEAAHSDHGIGSTIVHSSGAPTNGCASPTDV
ncbi:helix-turn-helix domain-containing protein [Streptomyces silvensis]|uniref:helix-turn-helix domain-containing protein n=1 Tax=Streptomyces silvensis TaxID=1765722 RepID=UPI00099E1F5F|nr:helix-turn-helix domain-containing protein [Streptomyces silvensis]